MSKSTKDLFQRSIDYLRISVTDRCNLRCSYCMPEEGVPSLGHDQILRYEEIAAIVRAAVDLGVRKIRLTGGEPLARLGLVDLVATLARIVGVEDLAMTTNGTLLAANAEPLAQAGLDRVNVSLDTLDPDRFKAITRWGALEETLAGIAAARDAGLEPVKINTVVIRGLNDDEVVNLARAAFARSWILRFIEWMPIGNAALMTEGWRSKVVTAAEIKARIEAELGELVPVDPEGPEMIATGPARYYRLPGAKGRLGFITPISDHFCAQCNRLRLTADGQLRPCLLAQREIDLMTPIREGADHEEIKALLLEAIQIKPEGHTLATRAQADESTPDREMAQIGG